MFNNCFLCESELSSGFSIIKLVSCFQSLFQQCQNDHHRLFKNVGRLVRIFSDTNTLAEHTGRGENVDIIKSCLSCSSALEKYRGVYLKYEEMRRELEETKDDLIALIMVRSESASSNRKAIRSKPFVSQPQPQPPRDRQPQPAGPSHRQKQGQGQFNPPPPSSSTFTRLNKIPVFYDPSSSSSSATFSSESGGASSSSSVSLVQSHHHHQRSVNVNVKERRLFNHLPKMNFGPPPHPPPGDLLGESFPFRIPPQRFAKQSLQIAKYLDRRNNLQVGEIEIAEIGNEETTHHFSGDLNKTEIRSSISSSNENGNENEKSWEIPDGYQKEPNENEDWNYIKGRKLNKNHVPSSIPNANVNADEESDDSTNVSIKIEPEENEEAADKGSKELFCCGKLFSAETALKRHFSTKKHRFSLSMIEYENKIGLNGIGPNHDGDGEDRDGENEEGNQNYKTQETSGNKSVLKPAGEESDSKLGSKAPVKRRKRNRHRLPSLVRRKKSKILGSKPKSAQNSNSNTNPSPMKMTLSPNKSPSKNKIKSQNSNSAAVKSIVKKARNKKPISSSRGGRRTVKRVGVGIKRKGKVQERVKCRAVDCKETFIDRHHRYRHEKKEGHFDFSFLRPRKRKLTNSSMNSSSFSNDEDIGNGGGRGIGGYGAGKGARIGKKITDKLNNHLDDAIKRASEL